MPEQEGDWPSLPLYEWQDTYQTLHMYSQIVGKVRLELSPMMNHWWQVPLYLTARGLTTSPMAWRSQTFQMDFDFIDHHLWILTSDGERRGIPLGGAVRGFYSQVMKELKDLGIEVSIWPKPVEVPDPIPFDQDDRHATYEPEQARRCWDILRQVDVVLKEFRGRFAGKSSPVHFFWGSFDLAVTRFSGRAATPAAGADPITRAAYNAELSSVGWWPGGTWPTGATVDNPAFYSYTFPEPEGFRDQAVQPEQASYRSDLGEFILGYEEVRHAPDPHRMILDFAESTFQAGARRQGWPLDQLVLHDHRPGRRGTENESARGSETISKLAASKTPSP